MRLERLALKGLSSAFPGVIDLPLRDIQAGLIALTGSNGKGKTTLLEATPGLLYRQLPSRDGADPVEYAVGRDSYIEEEFTVEGRGTFRARLNLDGPKRQSDAVLLAILPDGTPAALNDGKRSTYDAVIKERFPSIDLFVNSSYAAQGRGDEFTRRKPSQRKDILIEILALSHFGTMAAAASQAAELADDARLRLTVQLEQLQRDTVPAIGTELDRLTAELVAKGDTAEGRKRQLQASLEALEQRAAVAQDQVAAYAAAQQRVSGLQMQLTGRQGERGALNLQVDFTKSTLVTEVARITVRRDADVADAANKISGNEKIQGMAGDIRAAVAAIAGVDERLSVERPRLETCQAAQKRTADELRAVEKQIATLVPVEHQLTRAQTDANLLLDVPCGGAGEYAACQFLVNATAAAARIGELAATLRPKAALADKLASILRAADAHEVAIGTVQQHIRELDAQRATHQKLAAYAEPLAAAEARIAELTEKRTAAERDAAEQLEAAQWRHDNRVTELEEQAKTLDATIARLAGELELAQADLEKATGDNFHAVQLQGELAAARREWDQVTAMLATVQSGRDELERRRQELAGKRARRTEVQKRLAAVEQELLEWRNLAKDLGKGGLPDLEIDAAGPTISATTNQILLECFGPRFSLELVTQVAKSDGSGMKDLFTVEVTDNDAGGAVRDISRLSGGEKVIVQEALMCAIAIFVKERMPMAICTLFRDETGAALDPENAIRYVQMLRKVRELGGYHHVLFISHNPAAAALADAQIRVGDGQAVIVHRPFLEAA